MFVLTFLLQVGVVTVLGMVADYHLNGARVSKKHQASKAPASKSMD